MAEEESQIVFYCKDCQKLVEDPVRKGKKYEYNCPVCQGYRVSFGTKESLMDFFHIKKRSL